MSSLRQDAFPYSQIVMRQVTAAQVAAKKFDLPITPNLLDKVIIGIEAYNVSATPTAPNNAAVIAATPFTNSYLTLVDTGMVQRMIQQPLSTLLRANNNGNFIPLDNFQVDMQKSYIEYAAAANITAGDTYMFTFYYREKTAAEKAAGK